MHCQELTSMKGLHVFVNLMELNISSNNLLSMSGLESLTQLESINLSCNKISQIFSLAHLTNTLKTLNLSHNRLISL